MKPKIVDPYGTQGGAGKPAKSAPSGAARRHVDRRLSSWLKSKRMDSPGTEACGTCKGTGHSGWENDRGETIVCPDCRGFGY